MTGGLEAGDVTDLGDEDRCGHRSDPVDLLDRSVAGVVAERGRDHRRELTDLDVECVDEGDQ